MECFDEKSKWVKKKEVLSCRTDRTAISVNTVLQGPLHAAPVRTTKHALLCQKGI